MIIQFKALDLDTFEGVFDNHVIRITRTVTLWRVFVDGKLTSLPASLSSSEQKRRVDDVADKVLQQRMAANLAAKPAARSSAPIYRRAVPKVAIPEYLTNGATR